ncbi:MAG: P-II family nitrogen regulator [Ignavibacteriota bacterium]|jgi:nitrogen regulatory protein PII|nr:P-II family nitrogen regulator [Ignavibacteriota bacterium]MBV6420885.1 Nitrogen regulatory protein P-II [Ignavibacteriaceae bacterium]MCO6446843.1 P-II family nitrogen regulator [Ignavibacterium album]MDT3696738.1 P-II family nitrogen regulator [Ignavibacterium sp.]QQS37152.1 MAG: P-II family nitrogen regulator [Ignavibacteriales bacterium]
MKEIKAYIRPDMADRVISSLELAGIKGMTIIDVSTIGGWVDPERSQMSIDYCEKYCSSVKIELVCSDEELEKFVTVILENAHTGRKGDGKIFVSDITDAISIRTKQHGAEAL